MPAKKSKSSQSIVWTIDPFETKNAQRGPLAKTLKVFSRDLSQKIRPFSVLSPGGSSWPIPVPFAAEKNWQALGTESVAQNLKKLNMRGIQAPTVEIHDNSSRRELVKDVLRFAKAQNAGYIAVNTRRLLSPNPFKVGGFAEALIGSSKIPVIAVSPKAKVSKQIKRILFPTDFSRQSHSAFRKTLQLASRFGASIELLHVEMPVIVPFSYTDMSLTFNDAYIRDAERERQTQNKKLAARWCKEALKAGIQCAYRSTRGKGAVAPSIISAAKRSRSDLISLAGYRSPNTPAILGGTVRDVLSSSKVPVLEMHT